MDHPTLSGRRDKGVLKTWLTELKEEAIKANAEWAKRLNINVSAAITAVKPSGTVSQLVDSASGIHPRYSDYYIRTVRTDKKDHIYEFLRDQGFPVEDAIGKEDSTAIFSFPMKAPEGSVLRNDMSALEQLKLWKVYQEHWCEHKPSVTISVREEEWVDVGAWVYDHFDGISGISFLPHSDHSYQQAPYEECDEQTYIEMVSKVPMITWGELSDYEKEDYTTSSQELACTGNACEVI